MNKEQRKEYMKKYRSTEAYKEKVKGYMKKYRATDHYKELRKEIDRRYREKLKLRKQEESEMK